MKRVAIVVALIVVAGIAGIVRSHSRDNGSVVHLGGLISNNPGNGVARDEIRRTFELVPGSRVEVGGINGSVNIETADTKTAEVFIERTGTSQEALNRRKIYIEADANGLRIQGRRGDLGFFARLFCSNPSERVTLKLPRQISLLTRGVNGSVTVGDVDGSVEVRAVNGRVQIAGATGIADFKGINGNVLVSLKQLAHDGVNIAGINGNIELELSEGVNADLEAHGMNGRVVSELSDVVVEKNRTGYYSAHIGSGGNSISVKGVNGNVRLTRAATAASNSGDNLDSKQANGPAQSRER